MGNIMKQFKIDRRLVPIKVFYFLYFAALAPILPYVMVYGRQLGIPEVIMGVLNGILPIIYTLAKPLFGYIADRFQRYRKFIFISILLVQSLAYIALYFIPPVTEHKINNPALCSNNNTYELISCGINDQCSVQGLHGSKCILTCVNIETECSKTNVTQCNNVNPVSFKPLRTNINVTSTTVELESQQKSCLIFDFNNNSYNTCTPQRECTLQCPYAINDCYENKDTEVHQTMTSTIFWGFVFFMFLATVGFNVTQTISDAICIDLLGENENDYGIQRVWGTIGWGVIGLVAGVIVDWWSLDSLDTDYAPAFVLAIVFSLLCLGSTYWLKLPAQPQQQNILKEARLLLNNIHVTSFIFFVVLGGMIDSMYIFFHFWYLEELAQEYETSNLKTLQGTVIAVQCFLSEIPAFVFSGKIIEKLGHAKTLSLVYIAYSVRYTLYYFLTNPWWTLPIELLQGPTYCLLYATIAVYAGSIAPEGMSATVQGIVGSAYDGIGYFFGCLLGGVLFRFYGGRTTFLIFALISILSAAAHTTLHLCLLRHKSGSSDKENYQEPIKAIEMVEIHQ